MSKKLPPGQHNIKEIMRWNIDHPGIIRENPKFIPEKWSLNVNGLIMHPQKFNWKQFNDLPKVVSNTNFHCVEGWSVEDTKWEGILFKTLIELVEPKDEAKYVFFSCSDGYSTSLKIKDLLHDDIIFTWKLNDKPLEISLGGPLRLIVPEKYAYKSPMWIEEITFLKENKLGFWEKRGYNDSADIWKEERYAK